MAVRLRVCLLAGLVCISQANAVVSDPLPDPLSLQDALRLGEAIHPREVLQRADILRRQAEVSSRLSQQKLNAYLDIYPRFSRFAVSRDNDLNNDSLARLTVSMQLTDFGRTRSLVEAAGAELRQQEHLLTSTRLQRKLEIIRSFFDVLLADAKYHADDEEMTRLFTPYDRSRQRAELGIDSQVEVLQLETAFREALIERSKSDQERRASRVRLALALNRSDAQPNNLVRPKFDLLDRELPDYQELLKMALAGNPAIEGLRSKLSAAELTVVAQNALQRPTLTGGMQFTAWEQQVGSREDVSIGLQLHMPLYQGGTADAAVAQAQADKERARGELALAELELRNRISELLRELEVLKTARRTAQTRTQYRELAADYARAEYDLEVQTTLGQSIARLTEADYLAMRDEFATVLAWIQMDALLGRDTTVASLQK